LINPKYEFQPFISFGISIIADLFHTVSNLVSSNVVHNRIKRDDSFVSLILHTIAGRDKN